VYCEPNKETVFWVIKKLVNFFFKYNFAEEYNYYKSIKYRLKGIPTAKLNIRDFYARGAGHYAQAGELNNGKIRFQSLNGTIDENDKNFSGESWFTDKTFNSLDEIQKFYGTKITPGHHFNKIDVFKMTRAQMNRAFKTGVINGNNDYHLITNNCASLVTRSMSKAFQRNWLYLWDPIPRLNHGLTRFSYYSSYSHSINKN
jgi:hypothetical protein